ncbi:MAG: Mut7-C RNAse domain-containing protein [Thermodesulfobacteriota bacterium]
MKFIADRMLGSLAKLLRTLGFDTLYSNRIDFKDLLKIAREKERIILTKNTLIKKKEGNYRFLFINNNDPKRQVREVITNLGLDIEPDKTFTRCLLCNNKLKKIQREDIGGKIPDYIFESYRDFSFCNKCKRIFWKGTHHEHMLTVLKEYLPRVSHKDM